MDFEFNDDQATLRKFSRNVLTDHSTPEQVRELAHGELDVDPKLWKFGTELGWTGLAVAEEHGGSGQGLVELCIVAEEIGRAVASGPFLPTSLVGLGLSQFASAKLQKAVLPGLAEGTTSATWALAEHGGDWTPDAVRATAVKDGTDFVLTGRKTAVQDAGAVNWILVTAVLDNEPTFFLIDRSAQGVSIHRQKVLDETRSFYDVELDCVRVDPDHVFGGGKTSVQWLCDAAAVLTSADSLGVGQQLLDMTVEYVKVRYQFDRPIGSFQAIKHKVSDMAMRIRGTHAATYYAAMALDAGTEDASKAATVAKSYASDGMSKLAGDALQSHGGIGFTWEHDLHLYLRRAKTDEILYGDSPAHQERLSTLLIDERAQSK